MTDTWIEDLAAADVAELEAVLACYAEFQRRHGSHIA